MNEIMCVREHRSEYMGSLPGLNRTKMFAYEVIKQHIPCGCLPDCQLNQYPMEMTSAILNRTFSHARSIL